MLVNKTGNILDATENVICHQVNVQGIMGGGLAYQIASRYPDVELDYKKFCVENGCSYDLLSGTALTLSISENQKIANCFTQKPNFDTDYEAIERCFTALLMDCKNNDLTVAVPYKYGCGIAHGDWDKVSAIFERLSDELEIDISVYKLEDK